MSVQSPCDGLLVNRDASGVIKTRRKRRRAVFVIRGTSLPQILILPL